MTQNITAYYAEIQKHRGILAPQANETSDGRRFHHIVSTEDPMRGMIAGGVCEVTTEVAARCMANKSHRLAEPAEVERFHAEQAKRADECLAITQKNKEKSVLVVSPELAAHLGMGAPASAKEIKRGVTNA